MVILTFFDDVFAISASPDLHFQMASPNMEDQSRYSLVSSFYGPGAVGGWYLTVLACLISFGVHPGRRTGSITPDLIAAVAIPAIASAHLILQVHYLTKRISDPNEGQSELAQITASTEASLVLVEDFCVPAILLYLFAVRFRTLSRGLLVAITGLFAFSAKCYVAFSRSSRHELERHLKRPFMFSVDGMLISVIALLLILNVLVVGLVVLFFSLHRTSTAAVSRNAGNETAPPTPHEDRRSKDSFQVQQFKRSTESKWIAIISLLILPLTGLASVVPLSFLTFRDLPGSVLPWIRAAASHIIHGIIPKSDTSIRELDQAVALLAGASVLGFTCYSTAQDLYRARLARVTSAR